MKEVSSVIRVCTRSEDTFSKQIRFGGGVYII